MLELALSPAETNRIRFGICPLEEVLGALRVLVGVRSHPAHLPWLDIATDERPIAELLAVVGAPHYITDFLAPPASGPETTAHEQLTQVRNTPPGQVAMELALVDAELGNLRRHPEHARDLLADQLELAWTTLIAPHWPRIKAVLSADIDHRSRRLADGGLDRGLAGLHEHVRLRGGTIVVDGVSPLDDKSHRRTELGGDGLMLIPSVFAWPDVAVVFGPPWQPSIIYPARGAANTWQRSPTDERNRSPLSRVVGRTKARILRALDERASTALLAETLGLSPATVSEHLTALHDAGLLTATRRGRAVYYGRSDFGDDFLSRIGRSP